MAATHVSLSGISVILGCFISIVHGAHFEYAEGGQQPCILLDINAIFDLSMGAQMADPFSIEGANTTAAQSMCGADTTAALLSLSVFPTNEQLKITFRRDAGTQSVTMSVVLFLDPMKHFENATDLPFELENSVDLPIGMMNMSYQCNTQQEMLFNQDPGYSMTMKITNLHVQAYNIENGQFSPAIECDQDMMATPPTTTPSPEPTTEEATTISTNPTTTMEFEITSAASAATIMTEKTTPETNTTPLEKNTTTPEPITFSTEPETTTPETVPTTTPIPIPKYEVKDGDTVCIAVQGEIKFNINYERNDSLPGSVTILLPEDAKVSGQCRYNGTNKTQEFKVSFFDDKWSFSALISQDDESMLKSSGSLLRDLQAEPSYSWKRVELVYVIDERFEDPKESDKGTTETVTKEEGDGVFRASDEGSYRCNTGDTIEFDEEVSLDLGNFQYKAFGKDDSGDFNNNDVTVCPADKSNINDGGNNRTLIIVLISVFGSLILITGIALTVWRCKKNINSSGDSHRTPLSNETHTNYNSYSRSIVKGSDEYRETTVKKDTRQQANKRPSTLSRTNEVGEVSGRQNQQRTGNSNSDRGNVFDII